MIFISGFIIFLSGLFSASAEEIKPLYIFLFIGDGMGMNQYVAAHRNDLTKYMDSFPISGEVTTNAYKNVTTDSAAAATAIATGVKTKNETLGLDPNGKKIENISEAAIENGMSVGIISSMSLNHATPAGFYAHIKSRKDYYDIGMQLVSSNIDYFGGGGFHRHNGREKNKESLYTLAERAGYNVFKNGEIPDVNNLKGTRAKIISVNPILRSDSCMPYVDKRPKSGRALSEFVKEAIQILSDNEVGFLIITEGGNIDYACHNNEYKRMLHEISDFDKAISEALDFYNTCPENTLILVTADHETGGLHDVPKYSNSVKWTGKYHTKARVPIFTIGVKSDQLLGDAGIIDNIDIAKFLFKLVGEVVK